MGRPPLKDRFCACPKDINTCCCTRKLPTSFSVELISRCQCLDIFSLIGESDITGSIPESIKFCMSYKEEENRWEAELNLADICCNKIWCFWFFCPERTPQPCGPSKVGLECPPEFDCNAMELRVWCRDICIEDDECVFENAFVFKPHCCNCGCSPCSSLGWIFNTIVGDVCSCGSTGGVDVIITCQGESNTPFECPSGTAPNCCCACTPATLSVCIMGSGSSGCACYDGSDKCITLPQQNKECGTANCEEFCLQGSLSIPGCAKTLLIAICCNFISGAIVFTHNNCEPGKLDPCSFNSVGTPNGFTCALIDVNDWCFVVGGSCCTEGPAVLCLDISE